MGRAAKRKAAQARCKAKKREAKQEYGACAQCGGKKTCPDECILSTWQPNCCPKKNGVRMTPHHVVPKHCFRDENGKLPNCKQYAAGSAPCICVVGRSKVKEHGDIHDVFDPLENEFRDEAKGKYKQKGVWSYGEASRAGASSVESVTGCPYKCIKDQIDDYHNARGIDNDTRLRADSTGKQVKALPRSKGGQANKFN
jgi:hypothetical protein